MNLTEQLLTSPGVVGVLTLPNTAGLGPLLNTYAQTGRYGAGPTTPTASVVQVERRLDAFIALTTRTGDGQLWKPDSLPWTVGMAEAMQARSLLAWLRVKLDEVNGQSAVRVTPTLLVLMPGVLSDEVVDEVRDDLDRLTQAVTDEPAEVRPTIAIVQLEPDVSLRSGQEPEGRPQWEPLRLVPRLRPIDAALDPALLAEAEVERMREAVKAHEAAQSAELERGRERIKRAAAEREAEHAALDRKARKQPQRI